MFGLGHHVNNICYTAVHTEPEGLLAAAAAEGFPNLTMKQLQWLADQRGLESTGDAFELILRLCSDILGTEYMQSSAGQTILWKRNVSQDLDFDNTMLDDGLFRSVLATEDAENYED